MMFHRLNILLPVGMLFLAACVGPVTISPQGDSFEIGQEARYEKELAYKKIIETQDRLFNVAFPILAANADFCGNSTGPAFGMTVWNLASVKREYQQAAATLYNLQSRLAVQHVADHSPAAQAGIRSGDFIVAVNGQEIPPGAGAARTAAERLRQVGYQSVSLRLERKGVSIPVKVQAVTACNHPVLLDYNNTDVNAFTDGTRIIVSKGIVRFVESDEELAMVLAHELGHIAMRHVDKQQQNALAGGIGGLAIDAALAAAGVSSGNQFSRFGQQVGASSYSVAFEREADYVGMYFMERAGYRSTGVADFWRRMAAEMPRSVSIRTDHPTSPERFIAIERTHQEIARKKAGRQALVPNFQQR